VRQDVKRSSSLKQVVVTTSDSVVLSANPRRRCLVLSGDGADNYFFALGTAAASLKGLCLTPTVPILTLRYEDIGELIGLELHCYAGAVSKNLTIIEAYEYE
jgi:hypothetical protein